MFILACYIFKLEYNFLNWKIVCLLAYHREQKWAEKLMGNSRPEGACVYLDWN